MTSSFWSLSQVLYFGKIEKYRKKGFGNKLSLKEEEMKNAFYCILKPLFFLKIFKFLSWLFTHVEETT